MKRSHFATSSILLLIWIVASLVSDPHFTLLEDETTIATAANAPISTTLQLFWRGHGQHEHPPLSDLLLHFWLPVAGRSPTKLRAPSMLLYVAGVVLLAFAARKLWGLTASLPTVLISTVSPFAFHFARLAGWYSLTFFLVAALTLSWMKYLERSRGLWAAVFIVIAVALGWTNYYGWVIVGCLLLDGWVIQRSKAAGIAALTAVALAVAYTPLWPAFLRELRLVRHSGSIMTKIALGLYNLYVLFVSESVAPWVSWLSVPAALAMALSLWLIWRANGSRARLFLVYFAITFAGLAVAGKIGTEKLLFISPWLILGSAGAIVTAAGLQRRILAGCLMLAAAVGRAGIVSRRWYAAPHFLEPWSHVAADAAEAIHGGEAVVSNSPTLAFYLNYALGDSQPRWTLNPDFYFVPRWHRDRAPANVLMVRGVHQGQEAITNRVEDELRSTCVLEQTHRYLRDPGAPLKKKFFPQFIQPEYRIVIERFHC